MRSARRVVVGDTREHEGEAANALSSRPTTNSHLEDENDVKNDEDGAAQP